MYGNSLLLASISCHNGVMGPVMDYHGFSLQRHISNEATVITYKAADGKTKRLAVKDAKFRAVLIFGRSGKGVPGVGLEWPTKPKDYRVVGSQLMDSLKPMPDYVTSDAIYNQWHAYLVKEKTARENCDIWMEYHNIANSANSTGVPGVAWCRNQSLVGYPCDLPNGYETMVVWACGDSLDKMDPTAASYPDLRLGYTSTSASPGNGRHQKYNNLIGSQLWSSTGYYSYGMHTVFADGDFNGHYTTNSYHATSIPVLELD